MRRLLAACLALAIGEPVVALRAATKWTAVKSQSLTVLGDESAATLGSVAVQLEQFRAVVGSLIRNAQRPLPVPTLVFVFRTHKELLPFLPLHNGKPASLGGYFQHDAEANYIALSLEGFEDGAEIVFHEYTHLLVNNAVRSIPIWLNEGLAEFYSTYALRNSGQLAAIGMPIARHVGLLRQRFLPLSELIAVDRSSALYNEGERRSIFYAESWALTHFLMNEVQGGPTQINQYVTAIAEGKEPDEAFLAAFGATPREYEKRLRSYIANPAFKMRTLTIREPVKVDAPGAARAMGAAETDAWLGDLQRRIRRTDEGARRIESAAAADATVGAAQLALAQLRLDQKRYAEAWPAFERAAALAPDDFMTQYLYGLSALRYREEQGAPPEAIARAALLKACTLNPDSSDAFAMLAYGYMFTEANLPQARAAIEKAIALAPGRLDYWLRSADIAALAGQIDTARTLLTQIAAVRIDPRAAEMANRRLEAIEAARIRRDRPAANPGDRPSVSVSVPPDRPEEIPGSRVILDLRKPLPGEERALGDLVEIECAASAIRFHLLVGDRTIVTMAKRMEDVELTEFRNAKDFTLRCGRRPPGDRVYLTWRPPTNNVEKRDQPGGARAVAGETVAVEFLPAGYVP